MLFRPPNGGTHSERRPARSVNMHDRLEADLAGRATRRRHVLEDGKPTEMVDEALGCGLGLR